MQLRIVQETGYLKAELRGRETAEEMRAAIAQILAECRRTGVSTILVSTRASRPLFKVQEFGLPELLDEMGAACRVALVADSSELRAADEHIATMAQQRRVSVRAFRSETLAVSWLRGAAERNDRCYRFSRIVIAGAPEEPGVYALWQEEELIYYGRTAGGATIRSRLVDHLGEALAATHYSWEIARQPLEREAELLRDYLETFGRLPRLNAA